MARKLPILLNVLAKGNFTDKHNVDNDRPKRQKKQMSNNVISKNKVKLTAILLSMKATAIFTASKSFIVQKRTSGLFRDVLFIPNRFKRIPTIPDPIR